MLDLTWLLIAVPLGSAFVLLLAGKRANPWGHWLGVAASTTAFIVALLAFLQMIGLDEHERAHSVELFSWINTGELNVSAGLGTNPDP